MKKIVIFIYIVLLSPPAFTQVRINNTIDAKDTELISAVNFLSGYFSEFSPKNVYLPDFKKYWSAEDCRDFKMPDPMAYAINTSIPTYMLGAPTILSAKPVKGAIQIKTLFSSTDSTGNVVVFAITNHFVSNDNTGKLVMLSPMKFAPSEWETERIRNVKYSYPSYHVFDKRKANELAGKIAMLEGEWELKPIGITYYFADTKEEIEHYRGFDFTIAMGGRDKPSGMSDEFNNVIYCGGWGENYFHEVVHLYLNRLFPQSPLKEGLAVYYGGSLGHDLLWHVKRVSQYLDSHPDINLNRPEDFYYMDTYTNPLSTLHGLICYIVYQKDGIAGLKRVMSYSSFDELFSKEYHVAQPEWDGLIRKMYHDVAKAGG